MRGTARVDGGPAKVTRATCVVLPACGCRGNGIGILRSCFLSSIRSVFCFCSIFSSCSSLPHLVHLLLSTISAPFVLCNHFAYLLACEPTCLSPQYVVCMSCTDNCISFLGEILWCEFAGGLHLRFAIWRRVSGTCSRAIHDDALSFFLGFEVFQHALARPPCSSFVGEWRT